MKNLKSFLLNIGNIVMGAIVYVFMALPYMTIAFTSGAFSDILGNFEIAKGTNNGYEIIELGFKENANGKLTGVAVSNIILCIFAGILILSAIFNLLVTFGVIKSSKATKIVNFVSVFSAIIVVIFEIVAISCVGSYLNEITGDSEISKKSVNTSIDAGLILNLIISFVSFALSIFTFKVMTTGKKSSKKRRK